MSRLADRFRRWLGKVEATEKRDRTAYWPRNPVDDPSELLLRTIAKPNPFLSRFAMPGAHLLATQAMHRRAQAAESALNTACNVRDDIARQLVTERNRSRWWRRRCMKARKHVERMQPLLAEQAARIFELMADGQGDKERIAALEAELRAIFGIIGPGAISR